MVPIKGVAERRSHADHLLCLARNSLSAVKSHSPTTNTLMKNSEKLLRHHIFSAKNIKMLKHLTNSISVFIFFCPECLRQKAFSLKESLIQTAKYKSAWIIKMVKIDDDVVAADTHVNADSFKPQFRIPVPFTSREMKVFCTLRDKL